MISAKVPANCEFLLMSKPEEIGRVAPSYSVIQLPNLIQCSYLQSNFYTEYGFITVHLKSSIPKAPKP